MSEWPQLNEDAALLSVREGPTTNRSVVAIGRLFKAFAPAQGNALRSSAVAASAAPTLRPDVSARPPCRRLLLPPVSASKRLLGVFGAVLNRARWDTMSHGICRQGGLAV